MSHLTEVQFATQQSLLGRAWVETVLMRSGRTSLQYPGGEADGESSLALFSPHSAF